MHAPPNNIINNAVSPNASSFPTASAIMAYELQHVKTDSDNTHRQDFNSDAEKAYPMRKEVRVLGEIGR